MKNIRLTDRLSGQLFGKNKITGLPGQFLLDSDGEIQLNGWSVKNPAYLVPSPGGRIKITNEYGEEINLDNWDSRLLPVQHEKYSYLMFANRLGEKTIDNGESFSDWLNISPLVLQDLSKVQLNDFDHIIERHIWHLEEICRRPQTRLRIEIELMPVGRARRIPPKAYAYLAAHTEDWEHRKLMSVAPRRILSTMPDELINFYENRLVARLVYELYKYLRIRWEEGIAHKSGLDHFEIGTYHRQQRIYNLMGESVGLLQLQSQTQSFLHFIEGLYSRIVVLLNSQVYKEINAQERDQVPDEVRNTNILVNDRHYRFVNLLWKEYLKKNPHRSKTMPEITKEQQDLCQGFYRFSRLIICHSLDALGYNSQSSNPSDDNFTLLTSAWGTIQIDWNKDQSIAIKKDNQLILRFVPIISTLASVAHKTIENIEFIQSSLEASEKKSTAVQVFTVILYPGQVAEFADLDEKVRMQAMTIGIDLPQPRFFGLIPISSYLPGSVERVGRAIRWAIWNSLFSNYPLLVNIPVRFEEEILKEKNSWLRFSGNHGIAHLLRQPDSAEKHSLQEYIRQKRSELQSKGGRASQMDIDQLVECEKSIELMISKLEALYVCPFCHQKIRFDDFSAREENSFSCTCRNRDCREAQWGLRICGNCRKKYPYLIQNGEGLHIPEKTVAGWLDDIFGMDILAEPCPKNPTNWDFHCPHCGYCPAAKTSTQCRSL